MQRTYYLLAVVLFAGASLAQDDYEEETTLGPECGEFRTGALCNRDGNEITHFKGIDLPEVCQQICSDVPNCNYFSHYVEIKDDITGHCYLHYVCDHHDTHDCKTDEHCDHNKADFCHCISGPVSPDVSSCL